MHGGILMKLAPNDNHGMSHARSMSLAQGSRSHTLQSNILACLEHILNAHNDSDETSHKC